MTWSSSCNQGTVSDGGAGLSAVVSPLQWPPSGDNYFSTQVKGSIERESAKRSGEARARWRWEGKPLIFLLLFLNFYPFLDLSSRECEMVCWSVHSSFLKKRMKPNAPAHRLYGEVDMEGKTGCASFKLLLITFFVFFWPWIIFISL